MPTHSHAQKLMIQTAEIMALFVILLSGVLFYFGHGTALRV